MSFIDFFVTASVFSPTKVGKLLFIFLIFKSPIGQNLSSLCCLGQVSVVVCEGFFLPVKGYFNILFLSCSYLQFHSPSDNAKALEKQKHNGLILYTRLRRSASPPLRGRDQTTLGTATAVEASCCGMKLRNTPKNPLPPRPVGPVPPPKNKGQFLQP